MTKVLNYINHLSSLQRQRYLSEIKRNSSYFEKGDKINCRKTFVPTSKDVQTMKYRDIAKIDEDKINKRQENLKVDIIMFTSFYIMLIYLFVKVLL